MAQRLTNLRVKFVSCVDDGANQLADIVLAKRNDVETGAANSSKENHMEQKPDTVETNKAAPEPVDIAKLVAAEVEKARADFQKKLDEANAEIAKAKQAASDAEKAALVEKDARETLEFTKRAESDIPHLPGENIVKGKVLKTLSNKLTAEEMAEVVKLLKAGDAAVSKTFASVGYSGSGSSGDHSTLETAIEKYATEKNLSRGVAAYEFMKTAEGKRLYQESKREGVN